MSAPGFWDDQEAAQKVVARLKALKAVVGPVEELSARIEDLRTLHELGVEAGDEQTLREVAEETRSLTSETERVELRTMLSGPHDAAGCYFSIHAGAGGTESCDWAEMLLRMYLRYFESAGFAAREIDRVEGEEAGIRSVTLHVKGPYAYGYLSCERGVHRLVRISPFDAAKRRHTSFASVDVLPEPTDIKIQIDWDKDVIEHVSRAGGPGGQNVNKVASAVRLEHVPTGITVSMRDEKSQHKNRAKARRILAGRVCEHLRRQQLEAEAATRKSMVGSGDRSQRIRTYNFPQNRCTDHRLKGARGPQRDAWRSEASAAGQEGANFNLQSILAGDLDPLISALMAQEKARRLAEL